MSDIFLGEIRLMPYTYVPYQWAACQGQLLLTAQYTNLFRLIGTQFGGNGTTTFALPDLRSRVAVGQGQGTGLSSYSVGSSGGIETVQLDVPHLASHSHLVGASQAAATTASAGAGTFAAPAVHPRLQNLYSNAAVNSAAAATAIGTQGGGGAHNNLQPFIALNYCIALTGIYPPRSST